MRRDEVTTSERGSGYSAGGATWSVMVVPDSSSPGDEALSFSPDEWQAFVAKVQAMAPYSARGRQPHAEVVCYAITQ